MSPRRSGPMPARGGSGRFSAPCRTPPMVWRNQPLRETTITPNHEQSVFAAINVATGQEVKLALQELWVTGRILPVRASLQVRHVFLVRGNKTGRGGGDLRERHRGRQPVVVGRAGRPYRFRLGRWFNRLVAASGGCGGCRGLAGWFRRVASGRGFARRPRRSTTGCRGAG
jgi:hypothetical protein